MHTSPLPPNSTVADPFSRTASLSQGLRSELSRLFPWVLQHILLGPWVRLCRRLLQSLPSAALVWQPSVQLSQPLSNTMSLLFFQGPLRPPCPAVAGQLCPVVNSLCWHWSHTHQVCRRASSCLLPCSLPVAAKVILCSALKSSFIVTHIPRPFQRNQAKLTHPKTKAR